jgi:triacylglycerol esterase/lipase EstA (alpha/beta hydrolase family)
VRLRAKGLVGLLALMTTAAHSPDAGPAAATARSHGDVPVVLVPGWLDTARDMAAMRIRFLGAGWPSTHVVTITFADPAGSNRNHASELDAAIGALVERTGAQEIDVVAYSMGGLATRWYLRSRSDAPVRRVVFIGSPNRGTLSAHLAWGSGGAEMMPGSAFLDTLNADQPAPEGVAAITIRTVVDARIVPQESATLPAVPDYEICCPTHAGLLRDPEVFGIVRDFLASEGSGASGLR